MAKSALAAWIALVVVSAATPRAASAVQAKCLASKTKCVATYANLLLKCQQKADTPGKPTDPNTDACLDKADAKFDGGAFPLKGCFEKLEAKSPNDCVTADDTASAAALAQTCVANLVAGIDQDPSDQSKCGVGKQKCVAKKLGGLLKCHQKAQLPGKPADPNTGGCIDKVKAKYDGGVVPEKGCVLKLETKVGNDCLPPIGNQADLETIVDVCVDGVVAALGTPPPTTTSTSTSLAPTTTSSSLAPTTTTSLSPTTSSTSPAPTTTTSHAPTTTSAAPTTTSTSSTTTSTVATPTTSSTTTPVPTTTTSTLASSATCSANGLNVTASLQYNEALVGGISAMFLNLSYAPPLSIPGSLAVLSVRQRVTGLLPSQWSVSPNDRDTNSNGVDDLLEVRVTATTTGSVQPLPIYRARYDCAAGSVVAASSIPCAMAQMAGLDGQPLDPSLVAQIHCSVAVAAAP